MGAIPQQNGNATFYHIYGGQIAKNVKEKSEASQERINKLNKT